MGLVRGTIVYSFDIHAGCRLIDLVVSSHHTEVCVFDVLRELLLKGDTIKLYGTVGMHRDFFSTDGEKQ